MKNRLQHTIILLKTCLIFFACAGSGSSDSNGNEKAMKLTAKEILGNSEYPAICYGGYREISRDIQPTLEELREDVLILHAMGFRILRTYNVHLEEATNLLKAIRQLKSERENFEMYVMLGAWIDCKNAWTEYPTIHHEESEANATEIARAVELANQYPDIVKIIAVGNEAMVKWATRYYVEPWVILKWVRHLQELKKDSKLPADVWITSSDNFASWGGGAPEYHTQDLNDIYREVDYISIHTYPMHDTHYNPDFWGIAESEKNLTEQEQITMAMMRARDYAINQYESVIRYMHSLNIDKPVHIGETGWASQSNRLYGPHGSKATDEYKSALYYFLINDWCNENNISCFYFEAFDEQWKDSHNPGGSENHFGLINLKSQAKYAVWDLIDKGVFEGLTRDGLPITKSFDGQFEKLWETVHMPPTVIFFEMAEQ